MNSKWINLAWLQGKTATMSTDPRVRKSPLSAYEHNHPQVQNPIEVHDSQLTVGQRLADRVAATVGSWPFITIQSICLVIWIVMNIYFAIHPGALKAFDPYPFILLNLALSFQAAYTGPIVMMSQNRAAQKDRLMAENDYQTNQTAEIEIRLLMEHLKHQDEMMLEMLKELEILKAQTKPQTA